MRTAAARLRFLRTMIGVCSIESSARSDLDCIRAAVTQQWPSPSRREIVQDMLDLYTGSTIPIDVTWFAPPRPPLVSFAKGFRTGVFMAIFLKPMELVEAHDHP